MLRIFNKILYVVITLFMCFSASAQNATEQQYKAAMQNAKTAFEAQHYSEAVFFYREALRVKPNAKLPQYKIEDIRTIYIDRNLEQNQNRDIAEQSADAQIEQDVIKTQTEIESIRVATSIDINEDVTFDNDAEIDDIAITKQAIEHLNITEETISIDDEPVADVVASKKAVESIEVEEDPIDVEETKVDDVVGNRQVVSPEAKRKQIRTIPQKSIPRPIVTPPMPHKDIDEPEQSATEPKKVESVPTPKPQNKPTPTAQKKQQTPEQHAEFVRQEQERLRKQYPNQKTVEELDQPGKHITRVIMNINENVCIYLKVKHSWGATFFFIDNPGEELKSTNEQIFNQKTNLLNYEP